MSTENKTVKHGDKSISYQLERKAVKNVNMRIKADGTIYISASSRVPISFIENFIHSRYDFIEKSLDKLSQKNAVGIKEPTADTVYSDGDTLYFLGKGYLLHIAFGENDKVWLENNIMNVATYDIENSEYIQKLIRNWYYNQTIQLFKRLNLEACDLFSAKYKLPLALIKPKYMKSRWGSCHVSDGIISMNTRLIYYNELSVKYVFIHEYAHFIVPNHSKAFYGVVSEFMPDYKLWSDALK